MGEHKGLMVALGMSPHAYPEGEDSETGEHEAELDDHPLKEHARDVVEAVHGGAHKVPEGVDHNHVAHALHHFIRAVHKMG